MLFQPTNITPNVLGGAENGTINASSGLTVSWQINGNSPLVAYRIALYQNDTASTTLYSSGIITLTNPIYPVDYKGEFQRCSHTISAADLANAGITNGNEYKLAIRQFWDADNLDAAHSVKTSSDVVFLTRAMAHVDIIDPVTQSLIDKTTQTFTAQYWQGASYSATRSYDPIEWVRWQIYDSADRGRTIYDSEKIYTQELKLDYDGFLNGRSYVVTLTIYNSVGQTATVSAEYDVAWAMSVTTDIAVATRLNNQSSAVKVSWDAVSVIPGTGTGNYYISNGKLFLNNPDGEVYWNKQNDEGFSFTSPWVLIMSTTLRPRTDNPNNSILSITTEANTGLYLQYDFTTQALTYGDSTIGIMSLPMKVDKSQPDTKLKIIINSTNTYVYRYVDGDGLTPSDTLYPSETLYPSYNEDPRMELAGRFRNGTGTDNLTRISVGSSQAIDFIEIIQDATTEQAAAMLAWAEDITDDAMETIGSYQNICFYPDFNKSLDAGNFSMNGVQITGWDVYRKRKSEAFARHLCTLDTTEMSFLDYGCGSQQGKYTYFVYPRSAAGTHITNAIQSNTIQPVFWNWSIVEATYNETEDRYDVINEYVFRNNVSSGGISNNNSPGISENFTPYPTVQMSNVNYQSGTLTGLIGQVGYVSYVVQYGNSLVDLEERFKTSQADILADNDLPYWENHGYAGKVIKLFNPDGIVEYRDDKEQRDAIWKLSTTTNHLFLKSRKGDVIEIRISGEISMSIMDNTPQQAVTASVPWVQVAEAADKTLITART